MKTSKAVSFEEFNNYPETITKEQMYKFLKFVREDNIYCKYLNFS